MAGHKYTPKRDRKRQEYFRSQYAAAATDLERFTAAMAWLLSSVRYAAKRQPSGVPGEPPEDVVAVLHHITGLARETARQIDRM